MAENTANTEPISAEDRAALIKLIEQRADTYGLLSRLYRVEVNQELLVEPVQ